MNFKFTILLSALSLTVSLITLNEIKKTRKIQKDRIQYLESIVNKKPLVILPEPLHLRIKFSKEDDTFYCYPVLDRKWKKPASPNTSAKSGLP